MNVAWRPIHAIPMLTVLTQTAASTAHVGMALRAVDLTVQVFVIFTLALHYYVHVDYVVSCFRYSRV